MNGSFFELITGGEERGAKVIVSKMDTNELERVFPLVSPVADAAFCATPRFSASGQHNTARLPNWDGNNRTAGKLRARPPGARQSMQPGRAGLCAGEEATHSRAQCVCAALASRSCKRRFCATQASVFCVSNFGQCFVRGRDSGARRFEFVQFAAKKPLSLPSSHQGADSLLGAPVIWSDSAAGLLQSLETII